MKPIYKSLALAAMTLQVSLALNAEARDDESASTIALQAELLDSLRVELVAQNVSGARNLIESGECTIDGSNLTITLDASEWTRGAMYRVQVLATFGTQTQVIYALSVTVPYYVALSDTPQEYEDTVTVVSTITDVTEADLDGLALEETSQEIKAAITPISQAAEAYNVGKTQLAQAITSKGVETSPTESYPEMAEKVNAISQETYEINGGEMYAAQQFGDGALWNLYDILAQMKTRFMGTGDYAALIVCEYYKGYDSLQLQGADGYYTCDGDYYDYTSPNHVWHDAENGKANRWVAFLYRDEGSRLDITNTAISPRSMYIGGHIGTIEYFVNGRLTDFVCGVEETDIVDLFKCGNGTNIYYTQSFGFNQTFKNIKQFKGVDFSGGGTLSIVGADNIAGGWNNWSIRSNTATFITVLGVETFNGLNVDTNGALDTIYAVGTKNFYAKLSSNNNSPKRILLPDMDGDFVVAGNSYVLYDIMVGEFKKSFSLSWWNPTTVLADVNKKAQLIDNIKNHILARVSDATGGTQLVFTVSTNMYNNIASEQIEWQGETMSLADAFLTKNWLLAGA